MGASQLPRTLPTPLLHSTSPRSAGCGLLPAQTGAAWVDVAGICRHAWHRQKLAAGPLALPHMLLIFARWPPRAGQHQQPRQPTASGAGRCGQLGARPAPSLATERCPRGLQPARHAAALARRVGAGGARRTQRWEGQGQRVHPHGSGAPGDGQPAAAATARPEQLWNSHRHGQF